MARIPSRPKGYTTERAKFWGVSVRAIQRWIKAGVDPTDDKSVSAHLNTQQQTAPGAAAKLEALRSPRATPETPVAVLTAAGVPTGPETPGSTGEQGDRDLWILRGKYATAVLEATNKGDRPNAKFYTDQFLRYDKACRETALMEERLGIREGDSVSREVCEKWTRAWAYWVMRSVDAILGEAGPKLAALADGLTTERIRAVLEPVLLEQKHLIPFARAAKIAAGVGAPDWAVAAAKDAVDDFLEHGAALFAEEMRQPASEPPAIVSPARQTP